MAKSDNEALIAEAADIFVRFQEDKSGDVARDERDAFLSRGKPEREAYSQVERAWAGVGSKRRKTGPAKITAALAILFAGYMSIDPLMRALQADYATDYETAGFTLHSGDEVHLDADSAIADNTDGDVRHIDLIEGAAFFDVRKDGRAFVVDAGDLSIEVIGTAFATETVGYSTSVAVSEGRVRVSMDQRTWTLGPGDKLHWTSEDEVEISNVAVEDIAIWRNDQLSADGLTLEEVVAVIDRRLSGPVILGSSELASARVSGTLNLSDPENALLALATAQDARLISLQPFGWLILP